ncbi:hypothetical protein EMPS_04347 [Entomortierella parvispora]|uniref:MARVEL domain-containing protein n=1 Tax=Entomortierella parvispora TaxID=205924 RepID=A0A9P3H8J2_9FUNG|nr:hypothetical protein EMPS_04347 [Entomortierella parvispora]
MVSQTTFRQWRIAVALVASISAILMAATYIRLRILYGQDLDLYWGDYSEIIVSAIFFFTTLYAAFGKPLGIHRFLRAFLLFALAVLILYVNLKSIHYEVQYASESGTPAFECGTSTYCKLSWSSVFLSIITGFLVIFDVAFTLMVGSLESAAAAPAIVEVVQPSAGYYPPQPYYVSQPDPMQQQQYYQQPMQQQQYYQQPMPQQQQYYQQPFQQMTPDGSQFHAQAQPCSSQPSPIPQKQPYQQ